MLLVRRPRLPAEFSRAALAARNKIKALMDAYQRSGDDETKRPRSEDFDDVWSEFKPVLSAAQNGRCGYCDRPVIGGDDGTIDHFRPKAAIRALLDDPGTWAAQRPHSASVRDRETVHVSVLGYHWLAYAWNNYVFACSSCNEKWKRSIFPVATPRSRPPRRGDREDPLLLQCYRPLRPSDHLQFNEDGTVEVRNGSRYGFETIRTVGLYREPLRDEREAPARDAYDALRRLADGDEERAVRDLKRLGHEKRAFAGVVRAIVEQQLAETWEEFLAMFAPPCA